MINKIVLSASQSLTKWQLRKEEGEATREGSVKLQSKMRMGLWGQEESERLDAQCERAPQKKGGH